MPASTDRATSVETMVFMIILLPSFVRCGGSVARHADMGRWVRARRRRNAPVTRRDCARIGWWKSREECRSSRAARALLFRLADQGLGALDHRHVDHLA